MAKNKRAAETATPPKHRDEAEAYLERIGSIQREIQLNKTVLAEAVARVTADIEASSAKLGEEHDRLFRGLQLWAEANRHALTDGGKTKTVRLNNGSIAWRLAPPSVQIKGQEAVLAYLMQENGEEFLRTKVEINREAMLANAEQASKIPGVMIKSAGESFVIEPVGQKEMTA
ncbi:MAG: host-nuclease inhibitor Gam family protein [Roseomonas sp.]|nr:host-nuclease inhibitor Gam family protein [Roseomonas sp.]MCA3299798.1 host-nuclease inhibitor Gam family protein [Roseomonas sp.]